MFMFFYLGNSTFDPLITLAIARPFRRALKELLGLSKHDGAVAWDGTRMTTKLATMHSRHPQH